MEPTQPLIEWVPGTVYPEVNLPGREAEHSLPYIAEVKSDGAILLLPHKFSGLNALSVKYRGNFTSNLHELNILQISFFVMNILNI
jgi:hypothetical protein